MKNIVVAFIALLAFTNVANARFTVPNEHVEAIKTLCNNEFGLESAQVQCLTKEIKAIK